MADPADLPSYCTVLDLIEALQEFPQDLPVAYMIPLSRYRPYIMPVRVELSAADFGQQVIIS